MTMQRFTLGMFVLLAVMVSIGVGTSHATRHTMTAGLRLRGGGIDDALSRLHAAAGLPPPEPLGSRSTNLHRVASSASLRGGATAMAAPVNDLWSGPQNKQVDASPMGVHASPVNSPVNSTFVNGIKTVVSPVTAPTPAVPIPNAAQSSYAVSPAPQAVPSAPVSSAPFIAPGKAPPAGQVRFDVSTAIHHIKSLNAPKAKVLMVGGLPQLGNWDVNKGVQLTTTPDQYPIFYGSVMLPAKTAFEYKFVVVAEGVKPAPPAAPGAPATPAAPTQQWEAINRPMTTAPSGVMTVKSEFNEFRGTDPRLTDEPFQLTAQEWSRLMKHHISPMTTYAGNYSAHMQTTEDWVVEV